MVTPSLATYWLTYSFSLVRSCVENHYAIVWEIKAFCDGFAKDHLTKSELTPHLAALFRHEVIQALVINRYSIGKHYLQSKEKIVIKPHHFYPLCSADVHNVYCLLANFTTMS